MNDIDALVRAMINSDYDTILLLGKKSTGNKITDEVRKNISSLSKENQAIISKRLERILYDSYFNRTEELDKLSKEELFYLKESLIYYTGRISIPNIELLKRIYFIENDKHLLLNIAFSSLITGDEEIETDFISRIKPGNDYDLLIRSWTMAFFANVEDPYSYIDKGIDNWSLAKQARLKRLSINDENNPKFSKAKAFRWLDLVVINLFLENRGYNTMVSDDYKIIENTKVDLEGYSDNKVKKLEFLKEEIINNNPY